MHEVTADRVDLLIDHSEGLRERLTGASVACVNSTASGGGVAEMLGALLPYSAARASMPAAS